MLMMILENNKFHKYFSLNFRLDKICIWIAN